MRDHIYAALVIASSLLSIFWNTQDLFTYWGTGLLTVGIYFVLLFFLYGQMVPKEQFIYGPPIFCGTWFLGDILASGFGPYPALSVEGGNYIKAISVTSLILFTLVILKNILRRD